MMESAKLGQIIYALNENVVCRFEVESCDGDKVTCLEHKKRKGVWVRWKVDSWYRPVIRLSLAFGSEIDAYAALIARLKARQRVLARVLRQSEIILGELAAQKSEESQCA
jgi:hypothetical protein